MMSRRIAIFSFAVLMTVGSLPVLAQQAGTISGNAAKEFEGPHTDHAVQIRNAQTGQIVQTVEPSPTGEFSVSNLELSNSYIVELFNSVENEVLCTEGPFEVSQASQVSHTGVEIKCGKKALWLLLAAPAIGLIAARSPSGL